MENASVITPGEAKSISDDAPKGVEMEIAAPATTAATFSIST